MSSANSLSNIVDKIAQLEQSNEKSQHSEKSRPKAGAKLAKPPKAVKHMNATELSQLFFIEYQFPVVANTRDNVFDPTNGMATQAMRVVAKKSQPADDDTILFQHNADYSVLFNSHSLENWWRSNILFKIFCRSQAATAAGASPNLFRTAPYLIGQARLRLKNALRSKNFKLIKKLAVYDCFNGSTTAQLHRKRIGKYLNLFLFQNWSNNCGSRLSRIDKI